MLHHRETANRRNSPLPVPPGGSVMHRKERGHTHLVANSNAASAAMIGVAFAALPTLQVNPCRNNPRYG